jgi:predicted TIM-barrel fold metal-dependent hydrolase
VDAVRRSLHDIGVDAICLSPLDAAWSLNPHLANDRVYGAAERFRDVYPVPVLDPTIPTWPEELARARGRLRVRLVKILPAYSSYGLGDVAAFFDALAEHGFAVIIQTRMEDPRRQHPLAQVADVPADTIAQVAQDFPGLTVILGGPRTGEIRSLRERLRRLPNLYADTSQADGLDALKLLVQDGLTPKLLFGTHAPLFHPWSALARVVNDLEDSDAAAILGDNARRLLGFDAR